MANIIFFKKNLLTAPTTLLLNGTGGGTPPLDQDPDWPMANLLLDDRYSFWKSSGDGSGLVTIDFDIGSSKLIGRVLGTMLRGYGGAIPSFSVDVYVDTVYPPTNLVDSPVWSLNNNQTLIGTTGRYLRFDVYVPAVVGQSLSLNLWAINDAESRMQFTHDVGLDSSLGQRWLREELRTPSGLLYLFEPAQEIGSAVREIQLVWNGATKTEWDQMKTLADLQSRFIYSDPNGIIQETTLADGRIEAVRRYNDAYDLDITLIEHP